MKHQRSCRYVSVWWTLATKSEQALSVERQTLSPSVNGTNCRNPIKSQLKVSRLISVWFVIGPVQSLWCTGSFVAGTWEANGKKNEGRFDFPNSRFVFVSLVYVFLTDHVVAWFAVSFEMLMWCVSWPPGLKKYLAPFIACCFSENTFCGGGVNNSKKKAKKKRLKNLWSTLLWYQIWTVPWRNKNTYSLQVLIDDILLLLLLFLTHFIISTWHKIIEVLCGFFTTFQNFHLDAIIHPSLWPRRKLSSVTVSVLPQSTWTVGICLVSKAVIDSLPDKCS